MTAQILFYLVIFNVEIEMFREKTVYLQDSKGVS